MYRRTLGAVLVAIGLLAVPAAASAEPSQFMTAHRGVQEPLHVRGASGVFGEQELNLPPFRVFCAAARATGEPAPGYTELRNDIKLSRCATGVRVGEQSVTVSAKVRSPLDLFYKGDGDASLVNPVQVDVPSLKCTITIAEGAQLSNEYTGSGAEKGALPYENLLLPTRDLGDFPIGYRRELEIHNDQVGLPYSFAGGCANIQPSQGTYSGSIVEEAIRGDFWFIPGAEWEKNEEGPPEGYNLEKVTGV